MLGKRSAGIKAFYSSTGWPRPLRLLDFPGEEGDLNGFKGSYQLTFSPSLFPPLSASDS